MAKKKHAVIVGAKIIGTASKQSEVDKVLAKEFRKRHNVRLAKMHG